MYALVVAPILIPLTSAAVALALWRYPTAQRWLAVGSSAGLLVASLLLLQRVSDEGIQVVQAGGWPAPFGITLVADLLSAIMLVLAGLMALAVSVYSIASVDERRQSFGYSPVFLALLVGVSGAFLTGDIFNLFVWFEVMLIASFVLMVLGGEEAQLEGGIKYVTLNLVSSALFLTATGLLYGATGSLNLAELAVKLDPAFHPGLMTVLAVLFLAAFGIKAAVFPLFFWLPASYHTPPVAVSAIFAGLLTKVGVYALIRVFTLVFVTDTGFTHTVLLVVSGLTMAVGVLGAIAQNEIRRILSFHIISQIGYMTFGLALLTPLGVAGAIFYVIHHIIVKTNLFLVSGIVHRLRGTYQLKLLGGLSGNLVLTLLFLVPALSLAGVPPLSGFFAKLSLIRAGLETEDYILVAVAAVVGFLTLFSMMKIWNEAVWKPAPVETPPKVNGERPAGLLLLVGPALLLASLTIAIGAAAGPVFDLSLRAGEQLLDRQEYIRAVLGPQEGQATR